MDMSYSNKNPFTGTISPREGLILKGQIIPGDYERLIKIIGNDPARFWRAHALILASPGGDIEEAEKIANFVKSAYLPVFVGHIFGPCVSACFFIYVAAPMRLADPRTLGIHRPYIDPSRMNALSPSQAEALQRKVLREARRYLEDLDVPTNLIDAMFQRASSEIYWLSILDVDQQLGRRPPWYEQFLIARCGFDKALDKQYFDFGGGGADRKTLLNRALNVDSCGEKLSQPEAEVYVEAEIIKAKKP